LGYSFNFSLSGRKSPLGSFRLYPIGIVFKKIEMCVISSLIIALTGVCEWLGIGMVLKSDLRNTQLRQ
jgi:hypothetical protein